MRFGKLLALTLGLVLLLTGCGPEGHPVPENDPEAYLEEVRAVIQGTVGEYETIQGLTLEDGDLRVTVDITQADPIPLTWGELAIARTLSITDAILTVQNDDGLWETVTVDFGVFGAIQNGREVAYEDDTGRHFPVAEFTLEPPAR